jgi:hypothetical protein
MSMDLAALGLVGAAAVWPAATPLLGLMALARLLVTITKRRQHIANRHAFRPDRLLRAAFLLLVADAAMWMGALDCALGREPRR